MKNKVKNILHINYIDEDRDDDRRHERNDCTYDELKDSDYLSNLICAKEMEDNWQLCYASQLYGSLFAVYIKVMSLDRNNDFIRVAFQIKTYKGLINIGFKEVGYYVNDNEILCFLFKVKGMSRKLETWNKKIDIRGLKHMILFYRRLTPLGTKFDSKEAKPFIDKKIFDTEYFFRSDSNEDVFFSYTKKAPALMRYKRGDRKFVTDGQNGELADPGAICCTGTSRLFFMQASG